MRQRLRRNVRIRRDALSLTVNEAAKRIKMHPRQWQKIEAGEDNVTMRTLLKLCEALDLTIVELMSEAPPRGRGPGASGT